MNLLGEVDAAAVSSSATGMDGSVLNVHWRVASFLVREGLVEISDNNEIRLSTKGIEFSIIRDESPAQRRRRKAARDLRAQEEGRWRPVPAGYSSRVDRERAFDQERKKVARDARDERAAVVASTEGVLGWIREFGSSSDRLFLEELKSDLVDEKAALDDAEEALRRTYSEHEAPKKLAG